MLPSGHIAAGYLVAYGTLHLIKPELAPSQYSQLLFLGAFFGFCPDLDAFYAFFEAKSLTVTSQEGYHRSYITHCPLFWLVLALVFFIFAANAFWQMFALLIWLGTWSHFFLDSFNLGIKWLWPFTNKYYAFRNPGQKDDGPHLPFFAYWMWFLNYYKTEHSVTLYLEILILVTAAVVFGYTQLPL